MKIYFVQNKLDDKELCKIMFIRTAEEQIKLESVLEGMYIPDTFSNIRQNDDEKHRINIHLFTK